MIATGDDTPACVNIRRVAEQRLSAGWRARWLHACALASLIAWACVFPGYPAVAQGAKVEAQGAKAEDLFDDIYERSKGIDASLKTLTARFRGNVHIAAPGSPVVARGTLAVVPAHTRHSAVSGSQTRARWQIDGDKRRWTGRRAEIRHAVQHRQRPGCRVQELRPSASSRTICGSTSRSAPSPPPDRPAYPGHLDPTLQSEIRENRDAAWNCGSTASSCSLDAIQMRFAGGETKKMEFGDIHHE